MARVVFVGLGFGGLYALRHFMDSPPEGVRVTAIDRRDRFVFTPLLYEYLSGELGQDVVAPRLSELVPEGVELRRAEVTGISLESGAVELQGGDAVPFDILVLAPGSAPAFHGVPGAERHAIPFYSLDDAYRLMSALRLRGWAGGARPIVVVGGGVVGVELAFALAELVRGRDGAAPEPPVVVLEALPDLLAGSADGVRRRAREKLAGVGIEVRTGVRVLEVEEEAVRCEAEGRETRLDAAVVAWTAGIRPSPLLDGLPAQRHGKHGVTVAPTLQLPAAPNVFVLGDAIAYPGQPNGRPPLPDTAQAALQEASVCATNVRRLLEGKELATFEYDGMGEFLRVGSGEAIANIRGAVVDGAAAALVRRAAYLIRMPAWAVRTAAVRQWLS